MTRARAAFAICLSLTHGACTPPEPRTRADISQDIARRTGAGLRGVEGSRDFTIPSNVTLSDGLSETEAVALSLWNNPKFQAVLTDLGFARADLLEAGLLPNPTFSLLFPLGPKQLEAQLGWSLSWLWQRGPRVQLATIDFERIAEQLVAQGLDTARDARVAHIRAIASRKRHVLAEQNQELWSQIVRLTEVQVAAGSASEMDLSGVQVEAQKAALRAESLAHDERRALADLSELLGLSPDNLGPDPGKSSLVDGPPPGPVPPLADLSKTALAARPELRAAELAMRAAGKRQGLADAELFQLTASLDANGQGKRGFEVGPGLALPIPLFNQNQAPRARASAELERSAWRYVEVRNAITSDVHRQHSRLDQALQTLHQWPEKVLNPGRRNIDLVNAAYASGEVSQLVVLQATQSWLSASDQQIELEMQAHLAAAELSHAVGKDPYAKE